MSSTFLSLQIGLSTLKTAQMGTETAGHNIANANTPGYSREVVDAETETSLQVYTDHTNYLGEGVNGRGQLRVTDPSLDVQYRDNNGQQNYWQTQNTEINAVAQVFNEPTGTGLRQSIDQFFTAWSQLGDTPADDGARASVLQSSKSLADAFHVTANQLSSDNTRYGNELSASVDDLNTELGNVANYNAQIIKAQQATGSAPNDLLDKRDALVDKISNYTGIVVQPQKDGSVTVSVKLDPKSAAYQSGTTTMTLVSEDQVKGTVGLNDPKELVDVQDLADQSGQLRSLYDMSQYISNTDGKSGVLDKLNALAKELVTSVNSTYQAGYGLNGQTGGTLFDPAATDASTIQVNSGLTTDSLDQIQASATPTSTGQNQTDGTVAQQIAAMYTTYDQGVGNASYASIVTQLGIDGAAAKQKNDTFTALTTQVTSLRQSVSGVNINEEMTNMIQFQQQYNAAAKFVSVFNDMLTTLIQSV